MENKYSGRGITFETLEKAVSGDCNAISALLSNAAELRFPSGIEKEEKEGETDKHKNDTSQRKNNQQGRGKTAVGCGFSRIPERNKDLL